MVIEFSASEFGRLRYYIFFLFDNVYKDGGYVCHSSPGCIWVNIVTDSNDNVINNFKDIACIDCTIIEAPTLKTLHNGKQMTMI